MTAEHLAEYVRMNRALDWEWMPEEGDLTDKGVITDIRYPEGTVKYGTIAVADSHYMERQEDLIHLPRLDQLIRMLPEGWRWVNLGHQVRHLMSPAWATTIQKRFETGTWGSIYRLYGPFPESAALQAVEFAKTGREWKDGRWD